MSWGVGSTSLRVNPDWRPTFQMWPGGMSFSCTPYSLIACCEPALWWWPLPGSKANIAPPGFNALQAVRSAAASSSAWWSAS